MYQLYGYNYNKAGDGRATISMAGVERSSLQQKFLT